MFFFQRHLVTLRQKSTVVGRSASRSILKKSQKRNLSKNRQKKKVLKKRRSLKRNKVAARFRSSPNRIENRITANQKKLKSKGDIPLIQKIVSVGKSKSLKMNTNIKNIYLYTFEAIFESF